MLPYSLPHPQLSLTPNGHLSLNAERVRTEPFLPMISPVTTTARTQLLSMDPSPTTDSNMPTQDMKPKFKPLLSGHPSLDATLDKLSPPMSSPVMTTTLTQNLMMDPLSRPPSKSLTHGHPSPDAAPDKTSPPMNSLAMATMSTHILMMDQSSRPLSKLFSDHQSSAKTQFSETQSLAMKMISVPETRRTQRTLWARPKLRLSLVAHQPSETE